VAARIGQDAFGWLDAPVSRVAGLDMPVPFSKALEEIYSPKGRLLTALAELIAY
jgi:2-oxoisovalerate dehydrogenase E1 component